MRSSRNHTVFFHLLGKCIKAFFVLVFSLLLGCFILALFGVGGFAQGVLALVFPWLLRIALTLAVCLAINALLEAI